MINRSICAICGNPGEPESDSALYGWEGSNYCLDDVPWKEILWHLQKSVDYAISTWCMIHEAYGTEEDRLLLQKTAGLFFYHCHSALWKDFVLSVSKPFERTKKGQQENLTFDMLVCRMEKTTPRPDKTIEALKCHITEAKKALGPFLRQRHKLIAHADFAANMSLSPFARKKSTARVTEEQIQNIIYRLRVLVHVANGKEIEEVDPAFHYAEGVPVGGAALLRTLRKTMG